MYFIFILIHKVFKAGLGSGCTIMDLYKRNLPLKTKKELEIIDITDRIKKIVAQSRIKEGEVMVHSTHTTLGIKINEYEPQLIKDYVDFLRTIVPDNKYYRHDDFSKRKNIPPNEPKNAHSHLRTLLTQASENIPLSNYKMELGRYQSILAVETSGPRKRKLKICVSGTK